LVKDELDLSDIFDSLEKEFPTIKSKDREPAEYYAHGSSNMVLIKASLQDSFEFLVAVF